MGLSWLPPLYPGLKKSWLTSMSYSAMFHAFYTVLTADGSGESDLGLRLYYYKQLHVFSSSPTTSSPSPIRQWLLKQTTPITGDQTTINFLSSQQIKVAVRKATTKIGTGL